MPDITGLGVWNWFIAAALLFVAEVLAPGIFMLWLGIAALLVGVISLFVALPWQWEGAAFVIFSAAAFPLWWKLRRAAVGPTDQPFLNRRTQSYVGKVFTLETPIVRGTGTIRIDDTVWRVSGPDWPAGKQVKVERAEGAMLYVSTMPDGYG
jgi:membrane protein implicated in regulation of membrane protease activity